jgi:transmembrane sensor
MNNPHDEDAGAGEIERQAASWILRSDRGLSPEEQDEFVQWLAANPRHRSEFTRYQRHWKRLDQLAGCFPSGAAEPPPAGLFRPAWRTRYRNVLPFSVLAAAAVVFAFVFPSLNRPPAIQPALASVAADGPHVLADGSTVELNEGAHFAAEYTDSERRVRLARGEAYFVVAPDAGRPFVVTAAGIDVRALGTAFNVRVEESVVEVVVAKGLVRVDSAAPPEAAVRASGPEPVPPRPTLVPVLEPCQRAVVSIGASAAVPDVATLTIGEVDRLLSWQHRPLDFTSAPLLEVVEAFNRRNVVQLILMDPELASIRVSGSFRSDNIDGFLRLIEAGFGAQAERRSERELYIRRPPHSATP